MSLTNLLEKNGNKVMRRMSLLEGRLICDCLTGLSGLSGIRVGQLLLVICEGPHDCFECDSKAKSYFATPVAYKKTQSGLKASTSNLTFAAYIADADIYADRTPGAASVTVTTWGFSQVNPSTFSCVCLSMGQGTRLKLEYRSMCTPKLHPSTLVPHSLCQVTRRLHMYGYKLEIGDFRDFVLGRIAKLPILDQKVESTIAQDIKSNAVVKMPIQAHPKMTPGQQGLLRSEYFEGTVARMHSCRGTMLLYLVQELRLALDTTKDVSPKYHLAVENV